MPFYDKFPYTNFQELNLDWIINALKLLEKEQTEFINNNVIKYADPIGWNITTQYEANTVVTDVNGNAYISSQPVPSGVNITNTDYWSKIGNFDALWTSVKDAITTEDEGAGTTASAARTPGDLVWVQDKLLRVTAAMIAGDTYVIGSNCVNTDIDDELKRLIGTFDEDLEELRTADTALQTAIDNEETARINADTALQTAIDNEETERTNADTALQGAIDDEAAARSAADTALQNLIDQISSEIISVKKKNYLFIGDSYLVVRDGQLTNELANRLGITTDDYVTYAEGSSGFAHVGSSGNTFNDLLNNAWTAFSAEQRLALTDIVFLGGANDSLHTNAEILTAIDNCASNCAAKFPSARVHLGFIGRVIAPSKISEMNRTCTCYTLCQSRTSWQYLGNVQYVLHDIAYMDADGVHPNSSGMAALGGYIAQALKTGSCDVSYGQESAGTLRDVLGYNTNLFEELHNDYVQIFTNRALQIRPDPVLTVNGSGVYGVTIGTNNRKYAIGNYYETCGTNVTCDVYYNNGAAMKSCGGFIYLYDNEVRLRVVAPSGGGFLTMENVNAINITQFAFTYPTMNC